MCSVPSRVVELIETFDRDIEAYHSQQYNETQLRREFIDPFFKELGWDVTNERGYSQAYKDVIHEDAIKVGGTTKAPDYCFRIGGVRKFFLEAKKPSVDIKGDPHPAYQLRRYAWSAKLPLSILTDFEEFAVYDCQTRPRQTDKADTARIMYFTYKHYPDKWAKIADVFSRDAILKGSFDKFAVATKGKRGTTTVDIELLAEIETWRKMLARIIALRNGTLTKNEINFSVQRTIDRILFLRMCEDRGIEQYQQLQSIISGDRTYPRLCEIFEKADQKYNSGLFHFHDEPGRATPPDDLTPNITIDDKDLKYILHSLYYPLCPYEFSVLPPEILGNVYEQFLGSVITISGAHRADVVPKPEVKKAGGVYYTPSYIVDYIVKNTVGRLLNDHSVISESVPAVNTESVPAVIPSAAEESIPNCHSRESGNPPRHYESAKAGRGNLKPLTPRQITNLKILDPACGSGSFLLGAYTYLLNYHRDWYVENDPQKYTKKIYQGKGGQWYLTNAEKKRILLNNIFGVDIDSQAVEVTKLSLLLKVLEGEDAQTLENQYRLFHERALPDLATNIKCGNSLIGPDFFDTVVIPSAEPNVIPSAEPNVIPSAAEESVKIIAAKPPQKRLAPAPVAGDSHETTIPNDLYQKINPFDWHAEFPQIFSRKNPGFNAVIGNPPYGIQFDMELKHYIERSTPSFMRNNDIFAAFTEKGLSLTSSSGLFGFIIPNTYMLGPYFNQLKRLILSQAREVYVIDFGFVLVFPKPNVFTCITVIYKRPEQWQRDPLLLLAKVNDPQSIANQIPPFSQLTRDQIISLTWAHGALISQRLSSRLPNLEEYCLVKDVGLNYWTVGRGKKRGGSIADRVLYQGDQRHCNDRPFLKGRNLDRYQLESPSSWLKHDWQKHIDPQVDKFRFDENLLCQEKIVYRQTADHLRCTFEPDQHLTDKTVHSIVWRDDHRAAESYMYLLGILNSQLFNYLYQISAQEAGRTFAQIKIFRIRSMPFRSIDFSDPTDVAMHDKMVKLVEQMLDLNKKLSAAKIPDEKTKIQRQINTTDKQIDNLVYQLYDLTEEEIKIIEESNQWS